MISASKFNSLEINSHLNETFVSNDKSVVSRICKPCKELRIKVMSDISQKEGKMVLPAHKNAPIKFSGKAESDHITFMVRVSWRSMFVYVLYILINCTIYICSIDLQLLYTCINQKTFFWSCWNIQGIYKKMRAIVLNCKTKCFNMF